MTAHVDTESLFRRVFSTLGERLLIMEKTSSGIMCSAANNAAEAFFSGRILTGRTMADIFGSGAEAVEVCLADKACTADVVFEGQRLSVKTVPVGEAEWMLTLKPVTPADSFSVLPDAAAVLDSSGAIQRINSVFTKTFGWSAEESAGQAENALLGTGMDGFHTGVLPMNQSTGRLASCTAKDGSIRRVFLSYAPYQEETGLLLALYKDVTPLYNHYRELQQNEETFRLIADYTQDVIRITGADGKINYASPAHERLTGMEASFFQGKSYLTFIDKEDMAAVEERAAYALEQGVSVQVEHRLFHKGGASNWVSTTITPVCEEAETPKLIFISRDISMMKETEENLRSLAMHDELTGLANRRRFRRLMEKEMARSSRTVQEFSLLMLDCDNFKTINDTYGHAAGDEVIRIMAKRITRSVRDSDTVARMGGDEFHVLVPGAGSTEGKAVCRRILAAMEEPIVLDQVQVYVTVSIGASVYAPGKTEDTLYQESDEALYEAKMLGKQTFHIYGEEAAASSRWEKLRRILPIPRFRN
ncbi:diguanylate cyclase domain-containing protein [Alkalicoccus urumqiensis]|uniref:Sensor domain-containing diguanylate cyclase n=1 Tax=Alkalicoccus urumqiensis TaxID=1548213 RepID=A0A2P6MLH1_ALKUR|nr:diguanylate cyclase [Alkalicoccus urumqiensis]PRO67127.1 hypothetical protein C6I21_00745 [Alkalicoccus urumqiensis]